LDLELVVPDRDAVLLETSCERPNEPVLILGGVGDKEVPLRGGEIGQGDAFFIG
jgi:hypothetical protein